VAAPGTKKIPLFLRHVLVRFQRALIKGIDRRLSNEAFDCCCVDTVRPGKLLHAQALAELCEDERREVGRDSFLVAGHVLLPSRASQSKLGRTRLIRRAM
jgi:hypothetical protein